MTTATATHIFVTWEQHKAIVDTYPLSSPSMFSRIARSCTEDGYFAIGRDTTIIDELAKKIAQL